MASYIANSLIKDEKVLLKATVSFGASLFSILLAGGFVVGGAVAFNAGKAGGPGIIVGLILFVLIFLKYKTTELVVTNKRLIAKSGLIKRQAIEMTLSKIESLQVSQSIMGRMLNYGTIIISGAGNPQARLPNISAPLIFRKTFNQIVEDKTQQAS